MISHGGFDFFSLLINDAEHVFMYLLDIISMSFLDITNVYLDSVLIFSVLFLFCC